MKKLLSFVVVATWALATSVQAQDDVVVAQYDFEDGSLTSSDNDTNSSASVFASGAGIATLGSSTVGDNTASPFTTSSGTGDTNSSPDSLAFTASQASQTTQSGAVTANDYVTFSLTIAPGMTFDFTQLTFKLSATGSNYAEGFFVRSSLTGTTDLLSSTFSTVRTTDGAFQQFNVDLSAVTELQNVTSDVDFRIYFYNPDGLTLTNSDRLDKVQLTANVAVIPEPSTYAMIGLGAVLLIGIQRFRRNS